MADQIVSGDSIQAVAYALLLGIANKEGKTDYIQGVPVVNAGEAWVLDTYKKCLQAVTRV